MRKAHAAATTIQARVRGRQARAKAKQKVEAEAKAENWESLQDEAGQTYYNNTVTNKTMWERPEAIAQAQVATNLQARVRGNQARAEVKEILSEARKIYPQKLRRVKFLDEVRAEAKNLRRDEFLDELRAERALKRRENFIKETDKGYAEQEPMRATDFKAAQARAETEAKAENWEIHKDDDGDTYYHNSVTGITTWDRPEAIAEAAAQADSTEWESAQDPKTGQTYYYNSETGESKWEGSKEDWKEVREGFYVYKGDA